MLNYYNHENQNILFTFIIPQGRVHGSSSRGVTLYFRGFQSGVKYFYIILFLCPTNARKYTLFPPNSDTLDQYPRPRV